MKKEGEKGGFYLMIFLILIIIFLISLVSAGWTDWIKKTITGKQAAEQPQEVAITVRGRDPAQIVYVSSIPDTAPLELTNRTITFEVRMYDKNGNKDLNLTSVNATFIHISSGAIRTSGPPGSCTFIDYLPNKRANFSCSVDMWYWDTEGTWQIIVYGNDLGNRTWQFNDSTTFTYLQLKAMVISPTTLTWPEIVPEETNQTSDNHPTIINNTGNYNNNIYINATDLIGVDDASNAITADNFSIGISTGGASCPGTCPECVGTVLSSSQFTSIITASRGNLSEAQGQNNFYYCIPEVPIVLSQEYNTATGGAWTIAYRD